jgi:acyl-CoA thioester hydrolase
MAGTTIYRTAVSPDWIDYNGHVRDAYYGVALSLATDALMDHHLGLDAAYRARTKCTLYSLEMHIHWLREVKLGDIIEVDAHVLAYDSKRLHLGTDTRVAGRDGVAAAAEFMLLHYRQGENPGAATFPPHVLAAIEALQAADAGVAWAGPRSRALTLAKR